MSERTSKEETRLEDKLAEMREEEEERYEEEVVKEIVKREREKYRAQLRNPHMAIRVITLVLEGFWMLIEGVYKGIKLLFKQMEKN